MGVQELDQDCLEVRQLEQGCMDSIDNDLCARCSSPMEEETSWTSLCPGCIARIRPGIEAAGYDFEEYWGEFVRLAREEAEEAGKKARELGIE